MSRYNYMCAQLVPNDKIKEVVFSIYLTEVISLGSMCSGSESDDVMSLCFVKVLLPLCAVDFLAVLPVSSLYSRVLLGDPAHTRKLLTLPWRFF